jgi:hypothetical protein
MERAVVTCGAVMVSAVSVPGPPLKPGADGACSPSELMPKLVHGRQHAASL